MELFMWCFFCQMIREALQTDIAVMQKSSPVDLVTETDQKVEQLIISSIKEKYPTHRYLTSPVINVRDYNLPRTSHYFFLTF